jgi:cytochrome c peroxidase
MPFGRTAQWSALCAWIAVAVACSDNQAAPRGGAEAGHAGQAGAGGSGLAGGADGGSSQAGQAGREVGGGESTVAGSPPADAGAAGASSPYDALRRSAYPASPYPTENSDSENKALLGQILFWEEQLSGDDTVACGTCHRADAGGSDPRSSSAAALLLGSDGVAGTADDVHGSLGVVRCNAQGETTGQATQVTARKAPTYFDAMFTPSLFWDGRAQCVAEDCPSPSAFRDPDSPDSFPISFGAALENQAVGPPLSDVEMACEGASWSAIHQKLAAVTPLGLARQIPPRLATFIAAHDASYPKLFEAAFGDAQTSGPSDQINTRRIAFAIATHERRLRSEQTPWDRFNEGDDEALTPAQIRGLDLFIDKAKCEGCHRLPLFSDGDFHFIGFHRPSWDAGRKGVDTEFGVPGAMRTPTLRNVGLREASGLLHNGAGAGESLAKIVDLYDQGGLIDDPEVIAGPIAAAIVPLNLTPQEKLDLLDFLQHALDDPRVKAQTAPFDRPLLSTE